MKHHTQIPHRIIFIFGLLLALLPGRFEATAGKLYLTQLTISDRPVIDSVFRAVIHKSDSINGKSKRAFSVGWIERGDAILLDFDYVNPKYLDPKYPPKGFIIFNNRYFFVYYSEKSKVSIGKSANKVPFIVRRKLELSDLKEAGEWRYLITGNTYNELTFGEYCEFYPIMLFSPK